MSIFSIVDTVTAEIAAMKLQRQNEQAMIADVEALLGKLAAPKPIKHATVSTISDAVALMMEPGGATVIHVVEPVEAPKAPAPKPRRGRKPKAATFSYPYRRDPQTGLTSAVEAPKLNAIGKPYSPQYDPNYRMKYRTPKPSNKAGSSSAASIRDMDDLRAHIKSYWSA